MNELEKILFSNKTKSIRLVLALLIVVSAFFLWSWNLLPKQDSASYFNFADSRNYWGMPNALNVLSNLAFIWIGLVTFHKILFRQQSAFAKTHTPFGVAIALASLMTGVGSTYFHLNPSPHTLVWDRLPMTIGFSGILGFFIAERIELALAKKLLSAITVMGMFTVIGYSQSWFTIRPYLCLQFGSLLFIVIGILLIAPKKISNSQWWSALGLYFVAKLFELADHIVFEITDLISGHTLKHLFAALSIYKILEVFFGDSNDG